MTREQAFEAIVILTLGAMQLGTKTDEDKEALMLTGEEIMKTLGASHEDISKALDDAGARFMEMFFNA